MKFKLILLVSLLFATKIQAQTKQDFPKAIAHVIIIGVDGLSPNGIEKSNTPVIHKMIADGAVKWNVRTVLPSSSSPNWASMIMGAGVEAHGVLDNDWEQNEASLPPIVSGTSGLFPTIFSVLRRSIPKAEIGAAYQWEGFGRLIKNEGMNFDHSYSTEDSTVNAFNNYIINKQPAFAFLQVDDVDGAGHGAGHGTPEYYSAVSKVDSLIGTILQAIERAGMTKNTMIIVTADHGGMGYGHGGASLDEAEIAMVFYGAGIKKGYQIKQQVYTFDLAATIAFALKCTPPYAWTGRAVKSAFQGYKEPVNLWSGKESIAAPIIFPDRYLYASAGRLYIDKPAIVEIKPFDLQVGVYYTLDGSDPTLKSQRYKAPFVLDKTAVVKARAIKAQGDESPVNTAFFRLVKSNKGNGLQTNFYNGNNWSHIPSFEELQPSKTWVDQEFTLNRNAILPMIEGQSGNFAVTMTGFIDINAAGSYTFYTQSDDGSQLFIDDAKVVDNNDSHGVIERSGKVDLKAGRHAIKLKYFNEAGGFWLNVLYKGPRLVKQPISADVLFVK
jgi:hypothetical protein